METDISYFRGLDYEQIAFLYDVYYHDITYDFNFYKELAQQINPTAHILELACGTGRLLIPLVQAGFEVTGLDLAESMLDRARSKLAVLPAESQAKAHLVTGDIRDLDQAVGDEKFDLIFIAFGSFQQHMITTEDRLASLRTAREHLTPTGRFVIDTVNPDDKYSQSVSRRLVGRDSIEIVDRGSIIQRQFRQQFYHEERRHHYKFIFNEIKDNKITETTADIVFPYVYPAEVKSWLEEVGFQIEAAYGSYKFEPFDIDKSERILYVCTL